jgi:uncharacterized membrane protein YbaN (DUF454 family)
MNNISQTQLANISIIAGILVMLLGQFGIIIPNEQAIFILAALWSLGSAGYSYYNRFKKGDINLLGGRK